MTDDRYHFYEPHSGHGLPHDPMTAIVGPRPIGWISSVGKDGVRNLAPYSFFNMLSHKPPLIGFCSTGLKNSVTNIAETGVFVWNLATRRLAEQMNLSSLDLPISIDEFELAGLTPVPGRIVAAARVAESPVSFECRMTEIIRLKDIESAPSSARLVVGQVVGVHIDRALLRDGIYDTAAAAPILRGGGKSDYFEVLREGHFLMARPQADAGNAGE